MTTPPTPTLQLFDNQIPPFTGGDYVISVTHTADAVAASIPPATQPLTLIAPQVALDPAEVLQCFPPPGATGPFGEVLASVLLAERSLPWERSMPTAGCPWLALLVFAEGELVGGDPTTHATPTTIGDLLATTDAVVPRIELEADVTTDQACTSIRVPAAVFTAVTPRVDELRWLAHVRASTITDGGDPTGEVAVVFANRFPAAEPGVVTRAVAHLVSVEGLTPWLVDDPVFTRSGTADGTPTLDAVVLLSLARWSFGVVADPAESFLGLSLGLLDSEYDPATGTHDPGALALRLPLPAGYPTDATDAGQAEVAARITAGYAPLTYHARSGEEAMAWYRGPITPTLVAPRDPAATPANADAALVYDATHGIFDTSLASAWQMGRAAALADRSFGQALFAYRQQVQQTGDVLADRLGRAHFPDEASAGLAQHRLTGAAVAAVGQVLATGLDAAAPVTDAAAGQALRSRRPDAAPAGAPLAAALDAPDLQAALGDAVADALAPVAQWLAGLCLLEPLPFTCLVPDPRMLPRATPAAGADPVLQPGAIRFGYLDANWIGAALAGATSLAVDSSRQVTTGGLDPTLLAAVEAAVAARVGLTTLPSGPITALLLRSDLVSGWPLLAVTPLAADGTTVLPVARSSRLAPGVLLMLVVGIPASLRLAEPHTGLSLGLDEQGAAELRNLVPPATAGDPAVGAALGHTTPVLGTTCLRPGGRTLAVTTASGLVATLEAALTAQQQPVTAFGPAALALQLVRAPEEITFISRTGGR